MITIEVHHLDRHCKATTQKTFLVHWGSSVSEILATRILHGNEADTLFELLRRALKGEIDYTLCGHYPNYGLRVIEDEAIKFETTVCLTCGNWIRVLDSGGERLHLAPGCLPELSSALQRLLPLSVEEVAQLDLIRKMDEDLLSRYPSAESNPKKEHRREMEHEILINPATGAVTIGDSQITLSVGVSRQAVATGLSLFLCSTQGHGNGYEWLHYQGLSFGGKPASLSVCFFNRRLREMSWSVNLRDNPSEKSWPSQEESDEEVAFVRTVLRDTLSRPFTSEEERFPWGVVWSSFDPRGGCASSGLRFG